MSLDLNSNEFNSGVAIFNQGNAGTCTNVTLSVEKKADPATKRPDWKLIATDAAGASTDLAFYYLDEANQYYENSVKRRGKILKHLLQVVVGPDLKIPVFANNVEMLDKCMELIAMKITGKKFAAFANYGTTNKPDAYIKLRNFVPIIANIADADSLMPTPIDLMVRPQPDGGTATESKDDLFGEAPAAGTIAEENWL